MLSLVKLNQTISATEEKNREHELKNEELWKNEIQKQQILSGLQDGTAIRLPNTNCILVEKMYRKHPYNYCKTTTEATQAWFREHHKLLVDDYEMLEHEDDKCVTHYFRLRPIQEPNA